MIPMFIFHCFQHPMVGYKLSPWSLGDKGWGNMFPPRKWGMSDFPILGIFPLEDTYINLGHLLTSWLSNPKILYFLRHFKCRRWGMCTLLNLMILPQNTHGTKNSHLSIKDSFLCLRDVDILPFFLGFHGNFTGPVVVTSSRLPSPRKEWRLGSQPINKVSWRNEHNRKTGPLDFVCPNSSAPSPSGRFQWEIVGIQKDFKYIFINTLYTG